MGDDTNGNTHGNEEVDTSDYEGELAMEYDEDEDSYDEDGELATEHAYNDEDLAPQMIPESDPDFDYGLINGDQHEDAPDASLINFDELKNTNSTLTNLDEIDHSQFNGIAIEGDGPSAERWYAPEVEENEDVEPEGDFAMEHDDEE